MKRIPWLVATWAAAFGVAATAGEPIRPLTNPVWLDSPEVTTHIHPIFIWNAHPDNLETELGKVPAGGEYRVYALQFEIVLRENLSLIAVKDGYINFEPDDSLTKEDGWADLGAGLKWVCWRDEASDSLVSLKGIVEIPIGDDEVWQGNGDGTFTPMIAGMTTINEKWQLIGTLGHTFPFDGDEESSIFMDAWHVSYALTDQFFPMLELNHFYVTSEGAGRRNFNSQLEGGVPAVIRFEGGDLINFGAANADENPHLVTLGLGGRYRINDDVDIGAAYEFPLTDEEATLTRWRVTADLVWRL